MQQHWAPKTFQDSKLKQELLQITDARLVLLNADGKRLLHIYCFRDRFPGPCSLSFQEMQVSLNSNSEDNGKRSYIIEKAYVFVNSWCEIIYQSFCQVDE